MLEKQDGTRTGEAVVVEQSPLGPLLSGKVKHPPDPVEPLKAKREWLNWPDSEGYWWLKSAEFPRTYPEMCRASECCGLLAVYDQKNNCIGSEQPGYRGDKRYLFTKVTDQPRRDE